MSRTWAGEQILRSALTPRGSQTRLARALKTAPSTVSRWANGAKPDPAIWPAIEDALELERGTLALGSDPTEQARLAAEVSRLRGLVDSFEDRIAELEETVSVLLETTTPLARKALKDAESERAAARRDKRAAN